MLPKLRISIVENEIM